MDAKTGEERISGHSNYLQTFEKKGFVDKGFL